MGLGKGQEPHAHPEDVGIERDARDEVRVADEDHYRLYYVRGPEGIIVALAEPLS